MHKPVGPYRFSGGLLILALFLTGCASGGNSRFGLSSQNNRLIDSARSIRSAFAGAQPLPRELDKRVAPLYTVEPGDVLLVQPANLDSPVRLPSDQPILPDGTIQLGRYGQLMVAGKTIPDIETAAQALVNAQTRDAGPITVRIVTRQSKVFYVTGEVNAPGAYPLNGNETVLDGLMRAGGLNDKASRNNIILARPTPPGSCRIVLPVCYKQIVQLGDTTTNYQLAAGDRIYVPARATCENWHKRKEDCTGCNGPQYPCSLDANGHCLTPDAAPPMNGIPALPGPASTLPLPPTPIQEVPGMEAKPMYRAPTAADAADWKARITTPSSTPAPAPTTSPLPSPRPTPTPAPASTPPLLTPTSASGSAPAVPGRPTASRSGGMLRFLTPTNLANPSTPPADGLEGIYRAPTAAEAAARLQKNAAQPAPAAPIP